MSVVKPDVGKTILSAKTLAQSLRLSKRPSNTPDGKLLLDNEEFVLVRKEVLDTLGQAIGDFSADIVLYKMGYRMGEIEARNLIASGKVPDDGLLRCLMRPFYYMASGLGTVDVLELQYDGNPKNFHVLYEDTRPVAARLVMGYSAGWKSFMLGTPLEAQAISHPGSALRVLVAPKLQILSKAQDPRLSQPRQVFNVTPIRLD